MATTTQRSRPGTSTPSRKRSPAPLIAVLALVAIAGGLVALYLHHAASAPASETSAPTAAVQPEVAPQALPRNHIYSETENPREEIAAALTVAKREHKRVLLDFGGNWCGDCQVLDLYFRQSPNRELLAEKFVVVHVFVGLTGIDTNLDVAEQYQVPWKKGVPALAVLDADGKLVYSQQAGEFEKMRQMDPGSVTEFLNRWKA